MLDNSILKKNEAQERMFSIIKDELGIGGKRNQSSRTSSSGSDFALLNQGKPSKRAMKCVFFSPQSVRKVYYPGLMKKLIELGATKQTLDWLTKDPGYVDDMFVKYFEEK